MRLWSDVHTDFSADVKEDLTPERLALNVHTFNKRFDLFFLAFLIKHLDFQTVLINPKQLIKQSVSVS